MKVLRKTCRPMGVEDWEADWSEVTHEGLYNNGWVFHSPNARLQKTEIALNVGNDIEFFPGYQVGYYDPELDDMHYEEFVDIALSIEFFKEVM